MDTLRIDEAFFAPQVPAATMDFLWSQGWRHQGHYFFRYTHCTMEGLVHNIIPLRVNLARFTPSKSQRRVWKRNEDVRWEITPAVFDEAIHRMFFRHSERFDDNKPTSLHAFFSGQPHSAPCECVAVKAWLGDELIAVCFMDLGVEAVSSVYAIFEPAYEDRSLGTLTMLKELEFAKFTRKRWLYQGFGTRLSSRYDYKRRLAGIEGFDWATQEWGEVPGL
ncbi:MAG: putative arginyl-tRNA:protein arginylyltransferase [Verrucomicrobiaceae bacterium]|nr:putative arginyl-tRNA:protein arginylyltransferase [Verrucomicrobiaceae bacterium]